MILKWPGGKKWIPHKHKLILPTQYNTYLEPFLGGGSVFFNLNPKNSILSDINERLINLFTELKENPEELFKKTNDLINTHDDDQYYGIREKFNTKEPSAVHFLYLNRTCFNGVYRENKKGEFNVPVGRRNSSYFPFVQEDFLRLSKVLKNSKLRHQGFKETLMEAKEGDFIFVDPPYLKKEDNYESFRKYGKDVFARKDLLELAEILHSLEDKCKILVSNFDLDNVKTLFPNWNKEPVEQMSYISGTGKGRKNMKEVLIYNYEKSQ
ncbi:Dam family site-specific DNA-(adenine-N6)-methyltransferase [Gammaproteobacteria bacterium]|nr:Dam family site-specific DNA-(adenine-N6)-methyltransferase [Gammaproteobacteria bacterium]